MVSQRRTTGTRDRLLAAAAAEFAARGYAGAKVDRIAARARVNKAMIYYHFANKADLYRAILLDVFRTIAAAVTDNQPAADPANQLRDFIRTVAREASRQLHFAAIWLRETVEGGTHIDASIALELRRVLEVLSTILTRGAAANVFVPAHPLIVQLTIVGPILLFAASATARQRLARIVGPVAIPPREALLEHVEAAAIGGLRGTANGRPRLKGGVH
jgi:TetR/AcrR family transcriptional regulator